MKNIVILAIETSCDDTSVAIIKNGKLLSNIVGTSALLQKKYDGIVPEIASRSHCSLIDKVFDKAIKQAKIKISDLTHIAYTATPGLIGSLHVGKVFAKQIASMLNIPLIPLDHMKGHAFSYYVDHKEKPKFPALALIASGGHTFIALFKSINDCEIINSSIDDAVGETLDKVGRALKLTYPGGISIDKIFNEKKAIHKIINHSSPSTNFSFSGIKTACLNMINSQKKISKIEVSSSILKWVVVDMIQKLVYYINEYKDVKTVLIGGGVSANSYLRMKLNEIKAVKILLPSVKYTNDNAAMIAMYGYFQLLEKQGEKN